MLAGGIVGGVIGGVTYYVTTPASQRNFSDGLLAAGSGAVGGALIGTGIGIAAAGATAVAAGTGASVTAASTILISAGTGTLVSGVTSMVMNRVTGSSFDRIDFALSSIGGTIEGAIAPGLGTGKSILASGAVGASESILSDVFHDQAVNGRNALMSGAWGLGSAAAGSGVEGLLSMVSPSSQLISSGIQPVDLTWLSVRDPILLGWIANSAAKDSASTSARTFFRDVIYEIETSELEEKFR